jgi:6-pyruvoyltetrahydropterin/6-carboxytetrahydropterin synthase
VLHDRLDHRTLNDVPGLENSTCENIAVWAWRALKKTVPQLSAITIWETFDSKCTYRGP